MRPLSSRLSPADGSSPKRLGAHFLGLLGPTCASPTDICLPLSLPLTTSPSSPRCLPSSTTYGIPRFLSLPSAPDPSHPPPRRLTCVTFPLSASLACPLCVPLAICVHNGFLYVSSERESRSILGRMQTLSTCSGSVASLRARNLFSVLTGKGVASALQSVLSLIGPHRTGAKAAAAAQNVIPPSPIQEGPWTVGRAQWSNRGGRMDAPGGVTAGSRRRGYPARAPALPLSPARE